MADETVQDFKILKTQEELNRAKDILIKGGAGSVPTFENIYGAGSAEKVITNTYDLPAPVEETSMLGNVFNTVKDMGIGVADGVEQAINETAQTINSAGEFLEDKFNTGRLVWEDNDNDGKADSLIPTYYNREKVVANKDKLGQDFITSAVENIDLISEPETAAGSIFKGISQFATSFYALGGGKSLARSIGIGAVADATAFDPYDANISNWLVDNDWAVPYLNEALATDVNDDEWANRLRNSVEGGILGLGVESVVSIIRLARGSRKAKAELDENGVVSDETLAEIADAETSIKPESELEVDADVEPVAVKPSDIPPKVKTTAPKQPEAPKTFVNMDFVRNTINKARVKDEVVPIGALDADNNDMGLFNYDKMDGPPDAFKIMESVQEQLKASDVAKSLGLNKQETHKQVYNDSVEEVADLIGGKSEDIGKTYLDAAQITANSAQKIVSGKMILQSTGRRINQLADVITKMQRTGDTDTAIERQLVDLMKVHADVQMAVKGIQTATARAVSAGRIRTADALDDIALDRLVQFGGSMAVKKLAKQIQGAKGNPAAQAKLIEKANSNKILGVINEVWINAILSGPRTHFVNLGSNTFNLLARPAIRSVGGVLTGNTQVAEEGVRQYVYLLNEVLETMKYVGTLGRQNDDSAIANTFRSFYQGEGVLDTSTKFDPSVGPKRAISSDRGGIVGGGINLLGKAVTLSGRTLTAEDEFFKQVIFRSRLKSMVTAQARRLNGDELSALGYKTRDEYISGEVGKAINTKENLAEQWEKMVKDGKVFDDEASKAEFIKQNTGSYNHTSETAIKALDEARETTFTTPLRSGTFTAQLQQVVNKFPALRQVMPFIQTPTNILRVSFERLPILNFAMKRQRELIRNGTPDEKAMIWGNLTLGAGFTAYAMNLAMNGKITGGGPSYTTDTNEAKLWNASPDWHPYSINVGTNESPEWLELKRLDPHGMVFGIVGDIYEMIEHMDEPDAELTDLVGMVAGAFANNVMSKTYMMSLNDTMRLLDGNTSGKKVTNTLEYRLASAIPYSSLSYEMNKNLNGQMTELRSFTDKVKSRIYGMDASAVKHDWLTGEAINLPQYKLGFIRQKKLDAEQHVAADVYTELRELSHPFVGPQKTIGDVELSAKQYQRFNELVGTINVSGRKNLIKTLDKQIKSKRYARLADMAEINQTRSSDDGRVKHLNIYIQLAKRKAKYQLFREYPELQKAVASNRRSRSLSKAGRESDPLITSISD
ncbi:hypothetical protein N9J49_05065 [Amylibacter sp.]|nr:hypothetical protein [Amylibacter sp.]